MNEWALKEKRKWEDKNKKRLKGNLKETKQNKRKTLIYLSSIVVLSFFGYLEGHVGRLGRLHDTVPCCFRMSTDVKGRSLEGGLICKTRNNRQDWLHIRVWNTRRRRNIAPYGAGLYHVLL